MPPTSAHTDASDALELPTRWWRARRNAATRSAVNDVEGMFDRRGDDLVDTFGEGFRVVCRWIGDRRRLNRIVNDQRYMRRLGAKPALRHHGAVADNGQRHDRQARLNR